ncbi:MAG: ribonuclease P protein component [Lachnospiraceae bacterium]|nr:ribonuclease P protein component [Lachnospiraceae bacterium]
MLYTESLKKKKDFQIVYKSGVSFANKYLVMYKKENNIEGNHLGISVSKKVGNSVVRHRITRLIRESYRLNEEKFEKGYDLIVVARVNAKGISYADMESALLHLAKLQKIRKDVKNEKNINLCD